MITMDRPWSIGPVPIIGRDNGKRERAARHRKVSPRGGHVHALRIVTRPNPSSPLPVRRIVA